MVCSVEFRYSFVFRPICWENTFNFIRQKSINTALVTEQTTEAIENLLVSYRKVEFIETSLITHSWYGNTVCIHKKWVTPILHLTVYVLFCPEKYEHVSINFTIPVLWHDIGSLNNFSCKTRTCLFDTVNSMVADALTHCVAMIQTMLNRHFLIADRRYTKQGR